MKASVRCTFLDEAAIERTLAAADGRDAVRVREAIARGRALQGLSAQDVAVLSGISDPGLLAELFAVAREVKERIYGPRMVLFAPLYVSNLCANECVYCAFRARNRALERRALTQDELAGEVRSLVTQGHKRILLVAGESYPAEGLDYVLRSIETIYATRVGNGEVRRVNVNIAPLEVDEFRRLKAARIGTYQLFQETYSRQVYERVHLAGPKRDFDWRVTVMDRALEAGIDDVGIGVLFGLCDWRFEVLSLLQHIAHLEATHGVGPHTISVPRLEPACGADLASHPPMPVSDIDFRKIVAILRLAVPYTGLILSTRESASIRHETFALGVSQVSAGSRTDPGGYTGAGKPDDAGQFALGDHRPLDEVVRDLAGMGFVPSFCTGCYRMGRTGKDFMDLARPGEIRHHCDPNALSTFVEYIEDYASPDTRKAGEALVARVLAGMDPVARGIAEQLVRHVRGGRRDQYV
jgi:2-iminoacetate synthase